jgi:hypothetical protein
MPQEPLLDICHLLLLQFQLEDGGNIFLRNFSERLQHYTDYIAQDNILYNHCYDNLKSKLYRLHPIVYILFIFCYSRRHNK